MDDRFDQEPTDEFEFKPLSEGLGFHKKIIDLGGDESFGSIRLTTGILPKSRSTSSAPVVSTAPNTRLSTAPLVPGNAPHKGPTLQRATKQNLQVPLTWTPALQNKEILESQTEKINLEPIAVNFFAGAFDAAMVAGLALVFSAIVFALTKVDLNDLIEILQGEGGALVAAFVLLVAVYEIYAVTCRSFFGKTLGEWAFESRLGTLRQQQSLLYPVRVAIRSLLVALTGFVLLPLLSLLFKNDIPGLLSGVSLYVEKK